MIPAIRIPLSACRALRCPACHSPLEIGHEEIRCTADHCAAVYSIINGIPILIHEENSVFRVGDFLRQRDTFYDEAREHGLRGAVRRLLPSLSRNIGTSANLKSFVEFLLDRAESPRVLVLGGSRLGVGMEALADHPRITLVETDVAFGPRTELICDAHDVPFDDAFFHGVVVQAVLEHTIDPGRCVAEIHRVLDEDGLVYSETAFMQPVHGGRYDFTRFTHLGHRRLFRAFREIDSGAVCGPGMALAWSWLYFLLSFARSRTARRFVHVAARLTAWPLKYVDGWLARQGQATDAASAFFFLGRKSEKSLTDAEITWGYRGAT